jgi:hypothetical protein
MTQLTPVLRVDEAKVPNSEVSWKFIVPLRPALKENESIKFYIRQMAKEVYGILVAALIRRVCWLKSLVNLFINSKQLDTCQLKWLAQFAEFKIISDLFKWSSKYYL